MRYVSFDPGGTTGVAEYFPNTNKWQQYELSETDHHTIVHRIVDSYGIEAVIYERFTIRQIKPVNPIALEYIGILKLQEQQYRWPLFSYLPQQHKHLWTDDKIKKLDLWVPGKQHAMDATRVLLYHLSKIDKTWLQRLR